MRDCRETDRKYNVDLKTVAHYLEVTQKQNALGDPPRNVRTIRSRPVKFAAGFLVGILLVGASISPRVSRNNLAGLETMADQKLIALEVNKPGKLLGATRGVYLDGYGAVFTTEVDLIAFAAPNPFRPAYNRAEVAKLKLRSRAVLNFEAANAGIARTHGSGSGRSADKNEQIAIAVTIPYWPWEESTGMPRQILMQATKSALQNPATLNTSLRVQEF